MAKRLVLAVDDEPLVTRLIQVNLERAGYAVQTQANSLEALDALKSGQVKPDLILLDVTMPYMDGFEMLNQIKADANLKDIPIMMVTARALDADIVHAQGAGVSQYLTKPINPTELVSMVKHVIGEPESGSDEAALN
jgi:CheY-like chemotaxis protein